MPRRRVSRALRHAFTILSALSLLLCMAAAVMWPRSYRHVTGVVFGHWPEDRTVRSWGVVSQAGGVELLSQRDQSPIYGSGRLRTPWRLHEDRTAVRLSHDPTGAAFSFAGFTYRPEKRHGYAPGWPRSWRVPYWFVVAMTAAPPVLWCAGAWKRRQRTRDGLCLNCGYDLRASPERCPDCGTHVQTTA